MTDQTGASPYASAAEVYATLGIGAPVPLPPNAKVPVPTGCTGWHNAQPDDEQVAQWIEQGWFEVSSGRLPVGNIALRLNTHVIGIDVDAYPPKHGDKTVRTLQRKLGRKLPRTWRTSARQDGKSGIYLYRTNPARRIGSPRHGDGGGIEFIQFGHRYAIVYPSVHPELGTQYRWWRPDGSLADEDEVPELADLPELPEAWEQYTVEGDIPEPGKKAPPVAEGEVGDWITEGGERLCRHMAYMLGKGAQELAERGSEGAHEEMQGSVWGVVRDSQAGHTGVAGALSALRRAFLAEVTWDSATKRRSAPKAEGEFKRLVQGAIEKTFYAFDQSREPVDPCTLDYSQWGSSNDLAGVEEEIAKREHSAYVGMVGSARAKRRIMTEGFKLPDAYGNLQSQLENPAPEPQWIIQNVLAQNTIIQINAQYKAGKTTLGINLAASLAEESAFLNQFPIWPAHNGSKPQTNVGVWNLELAPGTFQQWMFKRMKRSGRRARARVFAQHLRGQSIDILSDVGKEWTLNWLRTNHIRVWIIDPLSKLYLGGENDNTEYNVWWRRLEEIVKEAGLLAVVLIHHTGHATSHDADKLPRARGASAMMGNPDDLLAYRHFGALGDPPDPQDTRRGLQGIGRHVWFPELKVDFDSASYMLSSDGSNVDRKADAKDQNARAIVSAVYEFGKANADAPVKSRTALWKLLGWSQSGTPTQPDGKNTIALEYAQSQKWIAVQREGNRDTISLGVAYRDGLESRTSA